MGSGKSATQWRLGRLDELPLYAGTATKVGALVARDKKLLTLSLALPKGVTTWRLVGRDSQRLARWLDGPN